MKKILLFGAGKSATVLIEYLLSVCAEYDWRLVLVDANPELARSKINGHPKGLAVSFDIQDADRRTALVVDADLVISMLPATLHRIVAMDCLQSGRHLLTASYVDDLLRGYQAELLNKNLLFLCEMGLDPGIDHMSAMALIESIRQRGGSVQKFFSHCGGLIAPESDDNPWHYKISWNPRNIVLAGSTGAVYRKNGATVQLGYDRVYEETGRIELPREGTYDWYANRDSLSYVSLYGLGQATDFLRTTLRHPNFVTGWRYVVKAGLASERKLTEMQGSTFWDWFTHSLKLHTGLGPDHFFAGIRSEHERELVRSMFAWLGLLSESPLPQTYQSSADLLQVLVEERLRLRAGDRDMIVMVHELQYELQGEIRSVRASLVVKGQDSRQTAMAMTVGLPLGIAAKLILLDKLTVRGLRIPTLPEIFVPVLEELEQHGIVFTEEDRQGPL